MAGPKSTPFPDGRETQRLGDRNGAEVPWGRGSCWLRPRPCAGIRWGTTWALGLLVCMGTSPLFPGKGQV